VSGTDFAVRTLQDGKYVGRFAPSPTGPLHFGSLLAAVASYLQAKIARGKWLVRIEDLDTPRVVPGAADDILRTLAGFGFEWDGTISYQSQRLDCYATAIAQLRNKSCIYECSCSRTQIAAQHTAIDADELRYPGTCRDRNQPLLGPTALRFLTPSGLVTFNDRIQGRQSQDVATTLGDFVVRRRDMINAYHLAVVVDDAAQGITEIVRGADLLSSTARQILLQRALAYATPEYLHVPVAVDASGNKLSKSSQSLPVRADAASSLLWFAFQALCQTPPEALQGAATATLWQWAIEHWAPATLAGRTVCPAPSPD